MKRKKILWPPANEKVIREKGRQQSREGQPMWIALHHYEHDRTIRGQMHNACCDCGLDHLLTFEVVRQDDGQWWLVKRAYRTGTVGKRHE